MIRPTRSILIVLLSCSHLLGGTPEVPVKMPVFQIDVEAVLSKAGCNSGACHGNQNGKGGFRLSLRGQDPAFDYRALVDEYGGRRINLLDPENSLFLRKPTLETAHQGGQALKKGSEDYQRMLEWVLAGAPAPTGPPNPVERLIVTPAESIQFDETDLQLTVEAVYSDGTRRDVTSQAVYEASSLNVAVSPNGLVHRESFGEVTVIVRYLNQQIAVPLAFLPARLDFHWRDREPRNYVDQHVFAKLRSFRVNPAPSCDDHVFLRRAYLDTLGILPTAAEAKRFSEDRRATKRDDLIAELLARPEFADNWALKWADLLRAEEKVLDTTGVQVFHTWIRDSIAVGKGLDQFVRELITATGSTYDNPPANYFRALRAVNQRGEASARVFLGTRLQCAQCHNHPFDRWTQDDYYSWAALFARVDYKIVENKRDDGLDKNQFKGEQLVEIKRQGEVTHPSTRVVAPPKFLGAAASLEPDSKRLEELAGWLTSGDNIQFAKAQVNRLWFHLMGQGLVDPVDDFRVTNPASHPELLEELANDFIECGFDIRHILQTIMRSRTYQLSSTGSDSGTETYSQATVRRLTAEQLLDAQAQVLDAPIEFNGHPLGIRAGALPGVHKVRDRAKAPSAGDRFLFAFGKPERLMTCECERSDATTLSQALLLINGDCMDGLLTRSDNLISEMLKANEGLDAIVRQLYWSALSRPPTEVEVNQSHSILGRSEGVRQGLEDVAWALLNAKEFVFRQ